jgi:hypothetical protein
MATTKTINGITATVINKNGFLWSLSNGSGLSITQYEYERGHQTPDKAAEEAALFIGNYLVSYDTNLTFKPKKFVEYTKNGKKQWIAEGDTYFCLIFTTGIANAYTKRHVTFVSKEKYTLELAKELYNKLYEKIENEFNTDLDVM